MGSGDETKGASAEEVQHLVMSYTSTRDPDCQLTSILLLHEGFLGSRSF